MKWTKTDVPLKICQLKPQKQIWQSHRESLENMFSRKNRTKKKAIAYKTHGNTRHWIPSMETQIDFNSVGIYNRWKKGVHLKGDPTAYAPHHCKYIIGLWFRHRDRLSKAKLNHLQTQNASYREISPQPQWNEDVKKIAKQCISKQEWSHHMVTIKASSITTSLVSWTKSCELMRGCGDGNWKLGCGWFIIQIKPGASTLWWPFIKEAMNGLLRLFIPKFHECFAFDITAR